MIMIVIISIEILVGIYILALFLSKDKIKTDFLNSIKPMIIEKMAEEISKFDFSSFVDANCNFESKFLEPLYLEASNIVKNKLEYLKHRNPIKYILCKEIDSQNIKIFINSLTSDPEIKDRIYDMYNSIMSEKFKKMIEEDRKLEELQNIFDAGLDESEDIHVDHDIDPVRGVIKEEIIPQVDNENIFVDEDLDEEVTREEYSSYLAISNKSLFDTKDAAKNYQLKKKE